MEQVLHLDSSLPEGPMLRKSFLFAGRIVLLCRYLGRKKHGTLTRQLLRSGTAIGALLRESQYAESRADFIHKQSIALKEANETCYWLELFYHTQILSQHQFTSIHADAKELLRMLIASTKTSKSNQNQTREA